MFDVDVGRAMRAPSVPYSSPDVLMFDDHKTKLNSAHLYYSQQYTVQIIQLVEGPPPPPRHIPSVICDSSASSSSYSEHSDSSASDDDDDEEESACSSYCSSDLPPEELESPQGKHFVAPTADEELSSVTRMKRILAWRENFSPKGSTTADSHPSLLKRKTEFSGEDDDGELENDTSHTSKRSRYIASQGEENTTCFGTHPCPACDVSFSSRQSLRQHGRDPFANEACCAAVEYTFE